MGYLPPRVKHQLVLIIPILNRASSPSPEQLECLLIALLSSANLLPNEARAHFTQLGWIWTEFPSSITPLDLCWARVVCGHAGNYMDVKARPFQKLKEN